MVPTKADIKVIIVVIAIIEELFKNSIILSKIITSLSEAIITHIQNQLH
jgi:hypothetical protein